MNSFKHFALTAIWVVLLAASPASAETRYVSEIRKITLRTGPGTEYKISAIIPSGKALEVMEIAEQWTKVRVGGGKEGWVLSQFLQTEIPHGLALERLQKKHQSVAEEKSNLLTENKTLKEKNSAIETELSSVRDSLARLEADYETLKKASATFIELKAKYEASSQVLEKTKERADKFEKDFTMLYNDKRIKWILAGVGVLLLGFIIGYSTKPQRRRSTLR